jgi:hypothetical protein
MSILGSIKKVVTNLTLINNNLSFIKTYSTTLINNNRNDEIIDFLRDNRVKYCQGWSTLNLYVCPEANDSFHLNKNTG